MCAVDEEEDTEHIEGDTQHVEEERATQHGHEKNASQSDRRAADGLAPRNRRPLARERLSQKKEKSLNQS